MRLEEIKTRPREIRLNSQVSPTYISVVQKDKKISFTGNKGTLLPSLKPTSSVPSERKNQGKMVPVELPKRIELESCIKQVSIKDEPLEGTKRFDDAQELYGFADSLLDYCIIGFRMHYHVGGFGFMAHDIQIMLTGQIFQRKERKGAFNLSSCSRLILVHGEFIKYTKIGNGQYLQVRTEKEDFSFVRDPGETSPSIFPIGDDVAVSVYSSGYSISGLRFYIAPRNEVK